MNWRLILQLSMFGLFMAVATVYVVPSNIEPLFWLVIFLVCAYVIAKQAPGQPFLHGLLVSIVNSLWITGAHVLLFDAYVARHREELDAMRRLPISPRVLMLCVGPVIGVVSGLVLGLLAFVASRLLRRQPMSS